MFYFITSGNLYDSVGNFTGSGYSGFGIYKNNALWTKLKNKGPIPIGLYKMLPAINCKSTGVLTIPLVPHTNNVMFGRSGFAIHGDLITSPGNGSQGCPVLPPEIRHSLNEGTDRFFAVFP